MAKCVVKETSSLLLLGEKPCPTQNSRVSDETSSKIGFVGDLDASTLFRGSFDFGLDGHLGLHYQGGRYARAPKGLCSSTDDPSQKQKPTWPHKMVENAFNPQSSSLQI